MAVYQDEERRIATVMGRKEDEKKRESSKMAAITVLHILTYLNKLPVISVCSFPSVLLALSCYISMFRTLSFSLREFLSLTFSLL